MCVVDVFMSILADRPQSFRSSVGLMDSGIFIGSVTQKWQFMKKQVMAALKQHGDGLKHLEALTLQHGEKMLQKMDGYNGQPFDPSQHLCMTIASIMLSLLYGQGTQQDAMNFINIADNLGKVFQSNGPYMMLDILPILRFIVPSVKKAHAEFLTVVNDTHTHYDNMTASRRKTYIHPHVEFFIDHFFKLFTMNNLQGDNNRVVTETDICSIGLDIFSAGFETMSQTLKIMLALLVNHQDIQDKAHKEIVEVIGDRKPRIEDKQHMPFTQALILETLRYHSLIPLSFPHKARALIILYKGYVRRVLPPPK